VTASWDPAQYARYSGPRLRPALDLLQRIPQLQPRIIYDLGCGSGEITRMLAARWPEALTCGVDDSQAMLDAASRDACGIRWVNQPLQAFDTGEPADLIFSNAALHWLPSHATLFPQLVGNLRSGGVLAVQMPRNFDAPSHLLIAATAREAPWREKLETLIKPAPVHTCAFYHRLLAPLATEIDVWETRYLHALHGDDPVKEWTKGTWLRPFLAALPEADRPAFEASYAKKLREAYPKGADDITLFEFNRLFLVMRRR
jgi:trans-aconitate 2-methyltransferase